MRGRNLIVKLRWFWLEISDCRRLAWNFVCFSSGTRPVGRGEFVSNPSQTTHSQVQKGRSPPPKKTFFFFYFFCRPGKRTQSHLYSRACCTAHCQSRFSPNFSVLTFMNFLRKAGAWNFTLWNRNLPWQIYELTLWPKPSETSRNLLGGASFPHKLQLDLTN